MLDVWFKAFVQDHLDAELRVAPQVTARIVERPGLWMAPAGIERIVEDLRTVARATVPGETLDYGVLTGAKDRLDATVLTLLRDTQTGRPIAFNALSIMPVRLHGRDTEVVHLGLVMVDPSQRSHGLSWVLYGLTCLVLFARRQLRPMWLSNVTQVPAIVGMVCETFSDVYPRPGADAHLSFDHLVLAREIMRRHRSVFGVGGEADFDEERFVIANAYTGGSDNLKKTFEAAPKHRDEAYNAFCRTQLDYVRGDDVLQLCRLDLAAAQRFLTKNVPRRSLPAVAATLGVVALNRLLLPALHWLDASRPFGVLRPACSTRGS